MASLPSLALPSSAGRRRRPSGRSGSTRRRQEAPSQLLARELRRDDGQCSAAGIGGPCGRMAFHPCGQPVHRQLWRMWISSFCHALRLTIAVEKALTKKCWLDTPLTGYSCPETACLQRRRRPSRVRSWGLTATSQRGSAGCRGRRTVQDILKPRFPQRPQIGHLRGDTPDGFPQIVNSLWTTSVFRLQNHVSRGPMEGSDAPCYTRRPYGLVPRQAARRRGGRPALRAADCAYGGPAISRSGPSHTRP